MNNWTNFNEIIAHALSAFQMPRVPHVPASAPPDFNREDAVPAPGSASLPIRGHGDHRGAEKIQNAALLSVSFSGDALRRLIEYLRRQLRVGRDPRHGQRTDHRRHRYEGSSSGG